MTTPTDRDRWSRLEAILDEVLELPAAERVVLLDEACAGDPQLRAEVEELLAADEQAEGFMETPAGEYAAALFDEAAPPAVRLEGRQLGPYRVLRRVGAGGMGVVYEAQDTRLHRTVALKLLPLAYGHDPDAKERFVREARAASALDHPNICTVHDIGESDDGRLFIVMSYYRGETLKEKLRRGPLPIAEARDLAIQVARGLERAHEAGITHRDVKPANVIVTDRGEAKILDFGIAKIAGEAVLTRPGASPATPAYTSPERARGEEADVRSDVWSLGVVLYEMLAGRRPFPGDEAQAVIYSILHREPEPLDRGCPEVPSQLARTVAKAMAKDPDERYQSVAELLADLDPGRPAAVTAGRTHRRRWGLAAAVLAGGLLALGGRWTLRDTGPPATTQGLPARPSIAVLRFQNLSGEAQLDWLRYGLADLVITDLSQSPEIDVLDLRRLDQILAAAGASDVETPSFEQLQQLADEVGMVLGGSFVRSDERLRINFWIGETSSDRILFRDWVEDPVERLFPLVDKVSRATRHRLALPERVELADTVAEVTTSSYEAWRSFSEGRELHRQGRVQEALPSLEKAIAIDPEFALALADLGNLHVNLGHDRRARDLTRRALEHSERLPIRQRFFVEGEYYSGTWRSYGRAIDVYRRGLELYPDDLGLRGNLAPHLGYVERYEEAMGEYQALIDRGDRFAGTYYGAASVHGALDRFETGNAIVAEFARRHPDDWLAQLGLGWNLTEWGRLDAALEPLRRAAALRPEGDFYVWHGWWRLQILRQDWDEARRYARKMRALAAPQGRWLGQVCEAWTDLYAGRSEEALERLAESARAYSEPEGRTALSHCWTARLLLHTGRPRRALEEAQQAQLEAPGEWPEREAMFLAAVAEQALDPPAADRRAEVLHRVTIEPNAVEQRQLRHLAGRLALARGETARARRELRAAVDLLPPRGVWFHWHVLPDHVRLWYALGEAELAAGRPENAAPWFRKVTASGAEHVECPILFVRSFYQLGKIYDALGDAERAAEAYGRFHAYWRLGDLDREEIEQAAARSNPG